ncbi:hypothetical protein HHX47_DHR7000308 [Lentinula edodes]|nr:hypothetical protein HHX47_DHR7000308 [Lentinula edodes]
MPRPILRLDDRYDDGEFEGGDLGTASSVLSSSIFSSSSNASSSSSPRTPKKGFALPALRKHVSRRKSSLDQLQIPSPSSPDLTNTKIAKLGRPQLTRSATLPKVPHLQNRSDKLRAELEALEVDSALLEKIRRWILGIAIDSLQFDQGFQIHSFRIRGEKIAVSSEKRPANIDEFIYGFSYFTQKRDSTLKRGYEQVCIREYKVCLCLLW